MTPPRGAEPGDISCVGGNLRFHQYHIQWGGIDFSPRTGDQLRHREAIGGDKPLFIGIGHWDWRWGSAMVIPRTEEIAGLSPSHPIPPFTRQPLHLSLVEHQADIDQESILTLDDGTDFIHFPIED